MSKDDFCSIDNRVTNDMNKIIQFPMSPTKRKSIPVTTYSKTSIMEYQHSRIEYYSKIKVIYFIEINFGQQQNPLQNRGFTVFH